MTDLWVTDLLGGRSRICGGDSGYALRGEGFWASVCESGGQQVPLDQLYAVAKAALEIVPSDLVPENRSAVTEPERCRYMVAGGVEG